MNKVKCSKGRPKVNNAGKKLLRLYLDEEVFKKILILSIDKSITKESIIEKGLQVLSK